MAESLEETRRKIAIACRILAMTDLVKDATGHISARIPGTDEMLIRCRGGRELGHLFTGVHHIRRTDFDGKGGDLDESYASPYEVPIHGEIYRMRPEVGAVIHAHPPYTLLCGLTGVEFRPIFGAYDPSALRFAIDGVPMFPRSVLVSNKQIAADMINAMGESDVVLMKGHGITVAAPTVEVAIDKATRLEQFARLSWMIAAAGRHAADLPPDELDGFRPRQGDGERTGWQALGGVENWAWDHYVEVLRRDVGLPDD